MNLVCVNAHVKALVLSISIIQNSAEVLRNLKISLEPRNQEPRLRRSLGDNLGSWFQENLLIRTKILPKTSVQSWLLVSGFQENLQIS